MRAKWVRTTVWAAVALLAWCSPVPAGADPPAADAVAVIDSLLAADQLLRNPATPPAQLQDAARRQQLAYRTLGRHPEWDGVAQQRVPAQLRGVYDRNIDARRNLVALAATEPKATLPPWRIVAPAPAGELLNYYRQAQAATGVGWNYLAAINLVETGFGRIVGPSSANAHGPMQFLPSTFAQYGNGGDIYSPRDAIMAAGRYLAASGFAQDPGRAVFAYNHSDHYVRAVTDYATVLAADPAAFPAYYRWDVYYHTTAGDVLLPIGYTANAPIPVEQYLAGAPR
ncbi:lytic transglycosylase domain-containing protein [Mycobacterium sp. 1274756.6]|uniref:lytic transglycosylase domain-containing protein n=1 Tax=Mycobacterium sp. 1274756.6 TaxID=1834076 RepID=UPI000800B25F|nr:lytic transglycosylase domain-containing protein [Mycobacterium sp. 1274756.6]OBJ71013.1 lytic transglycosylase [Mycobacterium sp. 1274756.6]